MEVMVFTTSNYARPSKIYDVYTHIRDNTRIKLHPLKYADIKEDNWIEISSSNDVVFTDNTVPIILFKDERHPKWQVLGTGSSGIDKLYKLGAEF